MSAQRASSPSPKTPEGPEPARTAGSAGRRRLDPATARHAYPAGSLLWAQAPVHPAPPERLPSHQPAPAPPAQLDSSRSPEPQPAQTAPRAPSASTTCPTAMPRLISCVRHVFPWCEVDMSPVLHSHLQAWQARILASGTAILVWFLTAAIEDAGIVEVQEPMAGVIMEEDMHVQSIQAITSGPIHSRRTAGVILVILATGAGAQPGNNSQSGSN